MKLAAFFLPVLVGVVFITPPEQTQPRTPARAPSNKSRVVHVYPHDPQAFTQGLVYLDGFLYEGTGLNGRSSIRKVRLENGEVLQIQTTESQYFGEGIAVKGDTLYQLTWQSEIGFLYDRATFKRKGTFSYHGEGWGLTYDGQRLIMSDGSAFLRFLDPVTLKEQSRIQVKDAGSPVG
ncbi:MAG: glutaminyl-peptide cyclotransferase, partial [Vicinamibacterales bacterium]